MSDDLVLRLVVVAGVIVVAVVAALVSRRGSALVRRSVAFPGLGPGVVLFSSATCDSCDEMRRRLADRSDVVELSYEEAEDRFPREIGRVPAVAMLDDSGTGWIAYGLVSERRLRRWLPAGP